MSGRRHCAIRSWQSGILALALIGIAAPTTAGDPAYGEYLASECVTCHRSEVASGGIPPLAGLPATYFINALRDYRAGRRSNPVMQNVARALDDEQMAALAAYYATLSSGKAENAQTQ